MKTKLLTLLFVITLSVLNAQTELLSSVDQSWNGSSWDTSSGKNYEYDGNGNLLSESSFNWNGSEWTQSYKTLYTYNSNNKATEQIFQEWNGSQYINEYRNLYTYDSNNNIIGFLSESWNGTAWEDDDRFNVTYTNNQISSAIDQDWDGTQWINEERTTFTYTANNLTEILYEEWNGSQWTLENGDREVITYNTNNMQTTNTEESWNGTSWDEDGTTEYVLDATGNRISETSIDADSYGYKVEYNYDTSALLNDFSHPFRDKTGVDYLFEDFPYVNKITSETELNYNSSTSTFDISYRILYDYDNQLTLSTQNYGAINKVSVYPNPSSDFIKIDGLQKDETIKIFNITGKKVFEKNITSKEDINIRNLKNGIYLLKMTNGSTTKIIKN